MESMRIIAAINLVICLVLAVYFSLTGDALMTVVMCFFAGINYLGTGIKEKR